MIRTALAFFFLFFLCACSEGDFEFGELNIKNVTLDTLCSNGYVVSRFSNVEGDGTTLYDWNRGLPSKPYSLSLQSWKRISELAKDDEYVVKLNSQLACSIDTITSFRDSYVAYYYNEALDASGWKYNKDIKIMYLYNKKSGLFIEVKKLGYY